MQITNFLQKHIFHLLLFTVAVIPLNQAFTSFCVLLTCLAAAYLHFYGDKGSQEAVLKTWQQNTLYLMLAITTVSIFFSLDKFISFWNFVYVIGQYTAFSFVLLRYGWTRDDCIKEPVWQPMGSWKAAIANFQSLPRPLQLLGSFLATSLLVSIIGIAQKFLGVTADGVWVDPVKFPELKVRVFSTLVNPNILAGYLVLVVSYALAFFNVAKGKRYLRIALVGTGLLAVWCLLYTYSRGNWLACAAVFLAFSLLFCLKAIVPLGLGGALAMVLGGHAVLERLTSIGGRDDTSTALRLAYLKSTKWIVEEFPLGVGWHGYRFVYPTYNFYLADTSVIMYHCHNIFLNVLAELGWHGLIVFLVIWFGIFARSAWRLAYKGETLWLRGIGRGYLLASIGIAIGGLTDHVYFNTQMGLLFWFIGIMTMISYKINDILYLQNKTNSIQ